MPLRLAAALSLLTLLTIGGGFATTSVQLQEHTSGLRILDVDTAQVRLLLDTHPVLAGSASPLLRRTALATAQSSPACFDLPNHNASLESTLLLRDLELCSTFRKRSACVQLMHNNHSVSTHRVRIDASSTAAHGRRWKVCIANLAQDMLALKHNKPLHPDMVPKLSVRSSEWNTALAQRLSSGDAARGDAQVHYQLQVEYQLLEQIGKRRARAQPFYTHVRKLTAPAALRDVSSGYVSLNELTRQRSIEQHSDTIVLDLRDDDDNDDDCEGDDCDFVVVGEAMPTWLFVVLAVSLAVLAVIIILVLIAAPTEAWEPRTRIVQVIHTSRPPIL